MKVPTRATITEMEMRVAEMVMDPEMRTKEMVSVTESDRYSLFHGYKKKLHVHT